MADEWDADDFVPQLPPVRTQGQWNDEDLDDVKESWEDEDEEEEKKPEPEKKEVKPSKKQKFKKFDQNGLPGEEQRELTEQEKIEMQKRSDLRMARELFGSSSDSPFDELETEKDFEQLAEKLVEQMDQHKRHEGYRLFCEKLFVDLADKMESKNVRKLATLLTGLADQKKLDERDKKSKTTSKKRPQIKGGKQGGSDMFDDFADGGDFAAGGGDFDDFM